MTNASDHDDRAARLTAELAKLAEELVGLACTAMQAANTGDQAALEDLSQQIEHSAQHYLIVSKSLQFLRHPVTDSSYVGHEMSST